MGSQALSTTAPAQSLPAAAPRRTRDASAPPPLGPPSFLETPAGHIAAYVWTALWVLAGVWLLAGWPLPFSSQ